MDAYVKLTKQQRDQLADALACLDATDLYASGMTALEMFRDRLADETVKREVTRALNHIIVACEAPEMCKGE